MAFSTAADNLVQGDTNATFDVFVRALQAATPAVQVVRREMPANPDALRPGVTRGPVIGLVWDPKVDHTSFAPGAFLDFVAVGLAGPINVPLSIGTLLCAAPPSKQISYSAPGVPFSIQVPTTARWWAARRAPRAERFPPARRSSCRSS